jgi:hypothetical protein
VAWGKLPTSHSDRSDVFARRYDSAGHPLGDEFQVNADGPERKSAVVARAPGGEFVVIVGTDQPSQGPLAYTFAPGGQPGAAPFAVPPTSAAAFVTAATFLVAGPGPLQGTGQKAIFGQVFDLSGTARSGLFRVDTVTTAVPGVSGVATDGQGNFVVAWLGSTADLNSTTLYARRFHLDLAAPCSPSATALCLQKSRFLVEASWQTADGSGRGQAIPLTSDTGAFWFFSSANVELLVKVLDGCGLTGSYWVFAGGLTNVGVTLAVTDMVTGQMRTYRSAAGSAFQPILDTAGLAVCGKRGAASGWWPGAGAMLESSTENPERAQIFSGKAP